MLFEGITLIEGSERQNLTVDSGTAFPSSPTTVGLFYRTDTANKGLYYFFNGSWVRVQDQNDSISFTPVNKNGDTMTGFLTLSADPTQSLHAATKHYVDNVKPLWSNIQSKPTTLNGFGLIDAQPLNADLTAIANLSVNGVLFKTSSGAYAARQLIGTTDNIIVTNGDGVNGNPTISLSTHGVAGTYAQVTVDAYGRVSNGSATLSWTNISNRPTTISGYGISDAQPLDSDLTLIAALSGSGLLKRQIDNSWTLDNSFAPLASPSLSGIPTAPTASSSTNNAQLATTAYVTNAVAQVVNNVQGGAVSSASKWTTPRNLLVNGDLTATFSNVDGSGDVTAFATLATVNGTPGSFGSAAGAVTITVNGKGLVTSAVSTPIAISASQVSSGTLADARVAQSNVTQYQSALSLAESQIANGNLLARNADNETITGTWTFSNPTAGQDPVSGAHFATKQYVDNLASGFDFKQSVKVATTANITLSGLQTIDGIALAAGDRILVKDQTTQSQNGIYAVNSGVWNRSADADNSPGTEVTPGMYCFVEQGTANADSGWVLSTDGIITLGTTALVFTQFTNMAQITAGNGLTKVGSIISAQSAASNRISVTASGIDLATVGNSGTGNLNKVNVDGYGRVIGQTPITTADVAALLSSTYQPLDGDLTSIAGLTGSAGFLKKTADNTWALDTTSYVSGNQTVTISGDASGSGTSSVPITLSTVNSNTGTFGSVSAIPVITVNGKGLITAVTTQSLVSTNVTEGTNLYYTDARSRAAISVSGVGLSYSGGVITSNATPNATASTVMARDASGNFAANTANLSNLFTTSTIAINGATGSYAAYSSGLTINYTGIGSQYGIALKPGSSTADTNAITFLASSSTYSSATAVAAIQHLANNAGMNLGGTWLLNGQNIATMTSVLALSGGTMTGMLKRSVSTISAAGTSQGTATAAVADIVVVSSATSGSATGIILPANATGAQMVLINATSTALNIYPPSSGAIDALAANAAFSLPSGSKIMFIATSASQFYTLNATYA